MNSLEQEYYCALLLLAEKDEKAAIPKTNRRILVRQHFEMRSVLVEFSTPFQNLMNYFSHPLSLKTWKLSDMTVIIYHQKVQVGKDQEKAQSEKDSHSKNRGGKKPN